MASLGIDLGTTYSGAASLVNGTITNISHQMGKSIISSTVTITDSEYIVGIEEEAADEDDEADTLKTVYDSKRMIGRNFSDPEIQRWISVWPFHVIKEENGVSISIQLCNRTRKITPTEISAIILKRLKQLAEEQLGQSIEFAIITVPARFNHHQRQATKEACELAGFHRYQLFQEPTAAAFDYTKRNTLVNGSKILVYDLGGGTFDVSIIEKTNDKFEVKFTDGDTALGGRDFDHRLMLMVKNKFERLHKCEIPPNSLYVLGKKCAVAKRLLSEKTETTIIQPHCYGNKTLKVAVKRADFDRVNQDLFQKTIDIVDQLLKRANLTQDQIDICLAVGGSARIPKIKELLQNYFGPNKFNLSINPDEAVMHGAARYAEHLYRPNNSDQSVWSDICPLNLGMKDAQGNMAVFIQQCTRIPCVYIHPTTTSFNRQTSIVIDVYEGNETVADHNLFIGKCELTKIPAAPAGQVIAFVKFEYTNEAVLKVSAICSQNGNNVAININLDEARQRATRQASANLRNSTIRGEADRRRLLLVDQLRALAHKSLNTAQSLNNDQLKKKAEEIIQWLNNNQNPTESDVVDKMEELEAASDDAIPVSA